MISTNAEEAVDIMTTESTAINTTAERRQSPSPTSKEAVALQKVIAILDHKSKFPVKIRIAIDEALVKALAPEHFLAKLYGEIEGLLFIWSKTASSSSSSNGRSIEPL